MKQIEHLISSLPMLLIGVSKELQIVYWDTKAEEVFDIAAAEVIGIPLGQCKIGWDREKIALASSRCLLQGCPIRMDNVKFRRRGGEERYLGLTIQPLADADNRIGELAIIGADITDRKKLETRLQHSHKMEAIGQLAAGIAHEINTPTQFVGDNTRFFQDAFADLIEIIDIHRKFLEAVKMESITDELIQNAENRIKAIDLEYLVEEIPAAIEQTLKGVERITNIVQAMKIFAHPGLLEKEPIDINKEIEKTITITRSEWKYVADLTTDFDPRLPLIPCFRAEFNQAILNMIVNAAHAITEVRQSNPTLKGTIRISTHRKNDRAVIRISDSGTGIPENIRHKIFDLFFTTKGPNRGTGQGLAICHSVIVAKHQGTLDVESWEGKGTTFIIGLPLSMTPADHACET